MKRIITFILALVAASAGAATTPQRAPLQVTNTTEQLPSTSKFFTANSNAISAVVASTLTAQNLLTVSLDNGDDASAVIGNPLKPFKTMKAACSNAPNGSIIRVLPGTTALTPLYNYVYETSASDLSAIPALLMNKTNVTLIGDGVEITGSGTGCYIGICNSKDITVQGFKFNLTKGDPLLMTKLYIGPITHYGTNVNLNFDRIWMSGATDQGITGNRLSYGLTVRDSTFYNIGSSNIAYVTNLVGYPYVDGTAISGVGSDTLVQGCRFIDNFRDVEWDGIGGSVVQNGFRVIGCTMSNTLHGSIVMYDSNTNKVTLQNIQIIGNTFQSSDAEHAVDSRDSVLQYRGQIWIQCGGKMIIQGNNFFNLFDAGIYLKPSSPIEGVTITGNTFQGGSRGITNDYNKGIVIENTAINATNPYPVKNITITGNEFSNLGSSAMQVMAGNVVIANNTAWDCGKSAGGLYVYWLGGGQGASNVVARGNFYSDAKSAFKNHMFAVSDPAKKIFIDRSNVGVNIDTSRAEWPLSVNSAVKSEVFQDGKTFTATLSGTPGTVTITHPLIHANSRIMISRNVAGGTLGNLSVTRSNETSFTITSTANETSTLAITIFEDYF